MSAHGGPADGGSGLAVRAALAACALALVALALWPALGGALVYDDLLLVQRNPALGGWSQLAHAVLRPHWDFVDGDALSRVGYWRPLALLALFAANRLGDGAPLGFHALSLALHLLSTAIVFALTERLVRRTADAGELAVRVAPFAVALLFGLHPVQVESVAWISAVNDPLAGALLLAAAYAHLRWRDEGSNGAPIAASALFLAALLAKESALAWLALAPALDLARARSLRPFLRAYAPFAGAVAVYWLARVAVFESALAGFDRITSYLYLSLARELTLRVELVGGALALLAWPARLNLFREVRPEIPWNDAQLWIAAGALVVWAFATRLAWRKRAQLELLGLLVMPASLAAAALRIESIGRFPLSERFLYVSAFGAALLAVALLLRALPRVPALLALALVALACGWRSRERTAFWKDEESVFRGGVAATPRSLYVRWGLGRVLLDRFQRTGELQLLLEARDQFEAAQDLATAQPPDPSVLDTPLDEIMSSLGVGWYQLFCALHMPQECTFEEAEAIFRGILARAEQTEEAHCGLGVTLRYLGRYDEAESELKRALEVNPRHRESWLNLGRLSIERQQWSDALEQFSKLVELSPLDADAWVALGMAAVQLDLGDRARQALARARTLAPDNDQALEQLGVLCAREGRFDKALEFFEQALKLDGSNGEAHLMRAKALVQLGRPDEALQGFVDAARWLQEPSPDPLRLRLTFEAFYNAGALMLQLGKRAEALPVLEQALARDPEGRHVKELRAEVEKLRAELAGTPPSDG